MLTLETKQRKQNSPKKYRKEGTGPRARKLCPNCGKFYLKHTKTHFNINLVQKTVMPLLFCKHCKYIEWNEEALRLIPD